MSLATCINVASYENALTRGSKYEVLAYDEAKDQVRVKGDNGRSRWFSTHCFDLKGGDVPVLVSFTIDDPIQDPKQDCIEVTVKLSRGRRRWCIFVTPQWLLAYFGNSLEPKPITYGGMELYQITYLGETITGASGKRFDAVYSSHMIIVPEISEETIGATLNYLDSQNELKAHTRWRRS